MDTVTSSRFVTADCLVQEVVEDYPQTIPVFAHHGLHCVGCYISPYHTISDCAREYAVDLAPLLGDLNTAATKNSAQK